MVSNNLSLSQFQVIDTTLDPRINAGFISSKDWDNIFCCCATTFIGIGILIGIITAVAIAAIIGLVAVLA